ncbi:MAG: hypothetical protein HOP13_05440 [Alphaproteobacteria bacterium]|nr:hypothetical protein [Alphaproteobacteria bacterium]
MRRLASIIVITLLAAVLTAAAPPAPQQVEGAKSFIARPKLGAAVFELPSAVRWRATPLDGGRYRIDLTADVNAATVLANVPALSARALNRDKPCDHLVRVKSASAKLTGPRTLTYDVRFHYAKRLCLGMPLEYPADVACTAKIAVAATRAVITIDVAGAANPPCRIDGLAPAFNDQISALIGPDVFKRHIVDAARLLPKEFQGVTIDIRTLAIDPKTAILHIEGEGTMSAPQFAALMIRIEAARMSR